MNEEKKEIKNSVLSDEKDNLRRICQSYEDEINLHEINKNDIEYKIELISYLEKTKEHLADEFESDIIKKRIDSLNVELDDIKLRIFLKYGDLAERQRKMILQNKIIRVITGKKKSNYIKEYVNNFLSGSVHDKTREHYEKVIYSLLSDNEKLNIKYQCNYSDSYGKFLK